MYATLLRKGVHSITAMLVAFVGVMYGVVPVLAITLVLFGVFLASRAWRKLDFAHLIIEASYGELFLAAGLFATAVFFLAGGIDAFLGGVLVLAFADPLAALVGVTYGTREYVVFKERRTYEGSTVCFLVAALILGVFGVTWYVALVGGLVLALIEALAPKGSDNLLLPVSAALLLTLLL